MLRTLAISSFLFVGAVSVADATDVFRWVDEHGGVHYSDQWVPGSEVVKSTKPHPTSTASADTAPRRTSDKPASSPPSDQNAAKAVKDDLTKVREQQCKDVKEKYDKAIEARRIYKTAASDKPKDIDGNEQREYLSDEEADAYRVKLREQMQDLCGNSAK